jgi:hypothetical protein
MKRTLAAFFALFCLSALAAFAQGNFLKKGQSGFGLTGAYSSSSSIQGFTGIAGISFGGTFDLSLGVERAAVDATGLADLKATAIAPQLTFHIIKQNSARSPVSVAFSIGYGYNKYSSPDLDAVSYTMWDQVFSIGVMLYRDVPLSEKIYLQPLIGGGYTNSSLKLKNAEGLTLSNEDYAWSFSAGLPVVYGISDRTLLVLEPGLITDKNATTFIVSLGFVHIFNTKV